MRLACIPLIRGLALSLALPLSAAVPAGVKTARPPKAPVHPVNVNTATATELTQLPHIGQKTAERIVLFRKQHGPFRRTEELMGVKGIGEKSFAQLRPYLTVSAK